jgi:hypothetical protein
MAADQNSLTMEIMKKVALKHGLVCLLHEKPFAGVNGSGKHNNWSMSTNEGENLLEPGASPRENIQFLTFLIAIVKAVDEYADLLRLSVASAGNDHRLGANEAPPAIISIFMGDELQQILDALESGEMIKSGEAQEFVIGVEALPNFPKDNTEYFEGHTESLVDWMRPFSEKKDDVYLRGFLGRMLFSGDEVFKPVNVLSGGEKVRMMLSRMMLSGANCILLDQPTNHLDMESIQAVNKGVTAFPGNVFLASHDHELLSTTADRIIEFLPNGKILDRLCGYDDYLAWKKENL